MTPGISNAIRGHIYGSLTDRNGLTYIIRVLIEMTEVRGLLSGVKICRCKYQLFLYMIFTSCFTSSVIA